MKYFTILTTAGELADVIKEMCDKGWCVDYIFAERNESLRVVTFAIPE